ncbi:MAG: BREX-1 system adenine-specific DNA-methyltransferase PglX [Chromatiales bacterium]|nr:BREX-1 system adenine-specific DNA-methyltransferase PglX [Chromatiales bacterium]
MQNTPLPKPLRTQLENTVKTAREIAEQAAGAALAQLAVGEGRAPDYLSESQRALRRRLRAHGRALGDLKAQNETQGVRHLVWEVAYQHWHRMLFARFLAESGLLLWEPGAPVSLDDCREMVDNHPDLALGARSRWELAGRLAARMLPQVFKPRSPVFELSFAPEHQRELERLLGHLPVEVFWASDSLGWVYQFWQAKRKNEVNASEVKIGADELPAVTQLFTEPYMVDFLLHNSLGAWWVTRRPDQPCPVPLTYLRTLPSSASQAGEGGGAGEPTPAAGRFEGWPERLADFRLLDPCCGSGHFLVAAFSMLVPMRMVAEELSAAEAVDAVLRDNLHGLELDARCVEIAVFACGAGGVALSGRERRSARRACRDAGAEDCLLWAEGGGASRGLGGAGARGCAPFGASARGLRRLHETFQQAPLLGSLLDPGREHEGDLFAPDYEILKDLLQRALRAEQQYSLWDETDSIWDYALSAQGLLEAAQLLEARYDLVITNVPYLARGKQSEALKAYCERHYPEAKNDLANVFLDAVSGVERGCGPRRGADRDAPELAVPHKLSEAARAPAQAGELESVGAVGSRALSRLIGLARPCSAILLTQTTMRQTAEDFELRGVDASAHEGGRQEKAALLREGERSSKCARS